MQHNETTKQPTGGRLTRRLFFLVLALVLAGAGVSMLKSTPTSGQAAQQAPAEDVNLSILEWNGYQHLRYHPEYNAKYGRQPDFAFFADEEAALHRMRTGYKVDLVHLCAAQIGTARDAGLIKPLDISRIRL